MNPRPSPAVELPVWRAVVQHPLFLGIVLLVPIIFLLPPLPIDETRYLAVAWEMHRTGEFLVPHLNGELYPQKPPLLFWLINAGWLVTGVHAWTARAMTLLCSVLSLVLLTRLVQRVSGSANAARASAVLLLGMLYFATFANAIMFDVLLTTCVLVALHGVLDLVEDRRGRGIVLAGLGVGLGVLTKGPVLLLDIGFAALLAPWWTRGIPRGNGRYFGVLAAALALGILIALAWAIPAALHGGPDYAHAIFLSQTFDRIQGVKTGTHAQPAWWYVVWLPVMLLPWPLVLRGGWTGLRNVLKERGTRLAIAWVLPALIVFSFIGGKQAHYLLPLLPGIALLLAMMLEKSAYTVRTGLTAFVLIIVGIGLALLPSYAATRTDLAFVAGTSAWWGAGVAVIGIALLAGAKRIRDPLWPALATVATVLLCKLALIQGPGVRYDVRSVAAQVHAAQERGQPIAHVGWHHGVYEFAGRLAQPLPALTLQELPAWAAEHPDGLVISFYRRFRFRAEPIYSQPFRGVQVSIWNVREALASGVDPNASHARDDSEDMSDDD
ncbi:MAG TPA: glycosyltransferase family 39 protein [Rhodanobacteraceae bacterium]|nr:glycosyltransferase family 39 protein [Rhodanobacteraceae bacterium]